jgi:hypothetical protein
LFILGQLAFFEYYSLLYRFATIQCRFPRLPKLLTDGRLVLLLFSLGSGVLATGILYSQEYLTVPEVWLSLVETFLSSNYIFVVIQMEI